ncbi:MAG: type 1 glutamine amidotransferase domain-containing protein [Elusimicrobiales bacterium]
MKKITALVFICSAAVAASAADGSKGKVLVVMSGADHITLKDGKQHKTGYFLSELAGPAQALEAAGYELVFANPTGAEPAMDKSSDSAQWFASEQEYQQAKNFASSSAGLKQPRRLGSFTKAEAEKFKAMFVPGGHAPMEDLARDKDMGRLLKLFHKAGKPTALICHGPAALLSSVGGGTWIYGGYKMAVFSNDEEKQAESGGGLEGEVPYYPAQALAGAGGLVDAGAPWTSHAVRDRELVTAQNPQSERQFTALLLQALAGMRSIF